MAASTSSKGYFKASLFVAAIWVMLLLNSGCAPTALDFSRVVASSSAGESEAVLPELQPNPNLSPTEVVKIQVEALQQNDDADSGIEITFRFASPANKLTTGPLFRFKEMVKNPVYRAMLNHKIAEYDQMEIDGDVARQRVTFIERNGEATVYLFTLSRQSSPECDGCWMTDSVTVVPTRRQDLQGI